MNSIEKKIGKILKAVNAHDIDVDDLVNYQNDFRVYYDYLMDASKLEKNNIDIIALSYYIDLNLIYYTYSSSGSTLITDTEYDMCMQIWTSFGHSPITTCSYEPRHGENKWDVVPHENPHMVGSLPKTYSLKEFTEIIEEFVNGNGGMGGCYLVPKYDGVSCCINIKNGKMHNALTRKDINTGLNIWEVISRCKNFDEVSGFVDKYLTDGSYGALKCEIVCASEDFEEIKDEFKNRRSAVSAVVSSPKNVKYAKYLTIVPLLLYLPVHQVVDNDNISFQLDNTNYAYLPPFFRKEGEFISANDDVTFKHVLADEVEKDIDKYRDSKFPIRVDGLVAYCPNKKANYNSDAMSTSYAFKINSSSGITEIKGGYVSIGRSGKATPMLSVYPCDVNETVVTDVSLSTFQKAKKFDLHVGDTVEIISAGDVIPQLKRVVKSHKHAESVKFGKTCPHCGGRIEEISEQTYACVNPRCPRVLSGQMATFFERVGCQGFSDLTMESILNAKTILPQSGLDGVCNVLHKDAAFFMKLDSWDSKKTENFLAEIEKAEKTPIDEAKFFAALGIDGVGTKTSSKILSKIHFDEISSLIKKGKWGFLTDKIADIDGCGSKTAKKIVKFLGDNWTEIELIHSHFNVVEVTKKLGSFALTGFSSEEKESIAQELSNMGYETGGCTKSTIACIAANPHGSSGKIKKAKKYGIPIIGRGDLRAFIDSLK